MNRMLSACVFLLLLCSIVYLGLYYEYKLYYRTELYCFFISFSLYLQQNI